MAVSFISVKMI